MNKDSAVGRSLVIKLIIIIMLQKMIFFSYYNHDSRVIQTRSIKDEANMLPVQFFYNTIMSDFHLLIVCIAMAIIISLNMY